MRSPSYSYTIDKNIVSIIDNDGDVSVTNVIEGVIDTICKKESIKATEYKWIYKDTEGIWDGFNPKSNTFIYLQTHLESDAKAQIIYKD